MNVVTRCRDVMARIASAAMRGRRSPEDVALVGVTKRHPPSLIREAYAAGVRHIGENFAQEFVDKHTTLASEARQHPDVVWHFIGRLQRNKVKWVVGRAALIHAVDSERLVRAIGQRVCALGQSEELGHCRGGASSAGDSQQILIAVNIAGEASKGGVTPEKLPALLDTAEAIDGVSVVGLMTMPPLTTEPENSRRWFAALRELRDRHATSTRRLSSLSMGTTADFEVAIEEGATLVRVGTALFGARPTP